MRILVPLGTRPEIVKLAPVVHALGAAGFDVRCVATGQHFDPGLTDTFFDELGLRPDARWSLPEGTDSIKFGALTEMAGEELSSSAPDLVLVLGDTNTVPVFCLGARRHRIPVAHLEAGMRSFNETSVEEVNRKVAAACASIHFAPTEIARSFLLGEGVAAERILVVGNPVTDVLADKGLDRVPVDRRRGTVVTAHRATNVDDPERLAAIVDIVVGLAALAPPVTFPVHPRTAARLGDGPLRGRLDHPDIRLTDPLPYGEMLEALRSARIVVTDSGGLQEEASWFGVPTVVLRRSTPRWEGVALGASVLVGFDPAHALAAASSFLTPAEQEKVAALPCPYGDGTTGRQVVDALKDPAIADLLRIREPDFTDGSLPAVLRGLA